MQKHDAAHLKSYLSEHGIRHIQIHKFWANLLALLKTGIHNKLDLLSAE